jgi:hypothetical protein
MKIARFASLLVAGAGIAHADPEPVVTAGIGAMHDRFTSYHFARSSEDSSWGAGVSVDAMVRVADELAIGAHLAVARAWTEVSCPSGRRNHYTVTPILLGVAASYTFVDHVWVTPWIGLLDKETRWTSAEGPGDPFFCLGSESVERRLAYGFEIGVDAYVNKRHRIGAYFQVSKARESTEVDTFPDEFDQDIMISFGVAYRYW